MGGKTPEHEISLLTGKGVVKNLDRKKYQVLPIIIPKRGAGWEKFISQIKTKKPDVVFIAMHGPFGEDGTVQGLLELIGVPYAGAGVLASAIGMDKTMFRKVMAQARILSPRYLVLEKKDSLDSVWRKLKLPVVVKPTNQGSSVGVSIVRQKNQLSFALKKAFAYGSRVMVEEFIKGTEISCGVLGNESPKALPVVEIIPRKEFFDYEAKYQADKCEEIVPARLPTQLTKKVQNLAVKVFQVIDCRGFGRVDMIIKQNQPYVLEINTIPGLTPNSLLPKEAQAAGISYSQLLDKLIKLALEK